MDMKKEWTCGLRAMVSFAVVYVIDLWCAVHLSCVDA